jgi:hypothetical protein
MQDWKTRHKLSRKWGKIMQGRSKIRIRALKREPYNKATVWVGSKVTKPGVPVPKKAPLHMLWKTHVVGDAIVQTCGKADKIFTKWARRLPNVPAVVPTWSLWPRNEERHDYGYAGEDAWDKEQSQKYWREKQEVLHCGISEALYRAVLEKTWKVVRENIGHGSDMKGRSKKVWTEANANRQCSSCGIHVSDKPEHGGAKRCRGARHTVAKFTGMCCSCRFDTENGAGSMLDRHSCRTCKRRQHMWERELVWRGIDTRPTARLWYEHDDPTTRMRDTEAPSQAAGSAWREHRRAMRTPMRAVRQLQSDEIDTILAQGMGRHNAWAGSNQEIQRSRITKLTTRESVRVP